MAGIFGDLVIPSLDMGDEVTIEARFGMPAAEQARTEVILSVNGFSAITNQGTLLGCGDEGGVNTTGGHYAWGQFTVSEEAQEVIHELGLTLNMENGELTRF